eukprot:3737726-Amphidinium_carterae.1
MLARVSESVVFHALTMFQDQKAAQLPHAQLAAQAAETLDIDPMGKVARAVGLGAFYIVVSVSA